MSSRSTQTQPFRQIATAAHDVALPRKERQEVDTPRSSGRAVLSQGGVASIGLWWPSTRSTTCVCGRVADGVVAVGVRWTFSRGLAAYPTVHPVVEQFRAVGVSRAVELFDPNDRTFCLAVIEAWSAQVGADELPPGISELRDALCDNSRSS
jgi:hypothetical protein